MKLCPKCQTPHDKPGLFCKRSCANSRVFSIKSKKLKSQKTKAAHIDGRLKPWFKDNPSKQRKAFREYYDNLPFDKIGYGAKRKRILTEQNNSCIRCSLSEWQGYPIILEIDHIDGNKHNNDRSNLEALCPNCHSLTPTWRGRKRNKNGTTG